MKRAQKGGSVMRILKAILGYSWAALAMVFVVSAFAGNGYFGKRLASATGVTISPWYTGGEVVRTIDHGSYRVLVHRPVFDGLIGERRNGFIQINWEPHENLPKRLQEEIDYEGDGKNDFVVTLDTSTGAASLLVLGGPVVSMDGSFKLKKGWAVRVSLRNEGQGAPERPRDDSACPSYPVSKGASHVP